MRRLYSITLDKTKRPSLPSSLLSPHHSTTPWQAFATTITTSLLWNHTFYTVSSTVSISVKWIECIDCANLLSAWLECKYIWEVSKCFDKAGIVRNHIGFNKSSKPYVFYSSHRHTLISIISFSSSKHDASLKQIQPSFYPSVLSFSTFQNSW